MISTCWTNLSFADIAILAGYPRAASVSYRRLLLKTDTYSRFSSKVSHYARCRPSYTPEAIAFIGDWGKLTTESTVADIGAGTGLVSARFVEMGMRTWAVEPNASMRAVADRRLGNHSNFSSLGGTSESTGLPEAGIDLIASGQAIHYFDGEPSAVEFRRILKPEGRLAILYHHRPANELVSALRELCLPELGWGSGEAPELSFERREPEWWFGDNAIERVTFPNPIHFDRDRMVGLQLSNSNAPDAGHPAFERYVTAVEEVFDRHSADGVYTMECMTEVLLGRIRTACNQPGSSAI